MLKNLLRNHKVDEAVTWHICSKDISLYMNCVFYFSHLRTLVAMATYSSHTLIMGKAEIYSFCCLIVNLIVCRGQMKGKFLKNIKIFSTQKPYGGCG